ncbi:kinase-like domain-containing protein [Glomus cerebriforme]|uniref:non-specific serine/threonine protein kinase n=1 Tax=Glomus cerebriforme TaxID=658196 RepID=A0A397TKT1_9GLOM|nr:kinase-like domain-containing protein [Glomus cerebriforme]
MATNSSNYMAVKIMLREQHSQLKKIYLAIGLFLGSESQHFSINLKQGWDWCNTCNAKRFQQNFKNWTSCNDDIDKFIQHTQLSAKFNYRVLEWIPYDRFYNIEYIAKGGFGKVYRAIWIDGIIINWDNKNQNWNRNSNKDVILKSLNNSKNITSHHKILCYDFISSVIRLYGITQDPDTKNYMMVLNYAENGSLRNYLDKNVKLNWEDKINNLFQIAKGLEQIHSNELIHRDLHIDYIESENTKNSTYGVLPYIAPEILKGQNYTKAADISA